MSLEPNRNSRDYLYGRLLAVAENIEELALYIAHQNRETNAARMMQRFASHPFSAWRNLELALRPYEAQLRASRPGFLFRRRRLIEDIHTMFDPSEYTNDRQQLSGEFLLGYHCQRAALRSGQSQDEPDTDTNEEKETE